MQNYKNERAYQVVGFRKNSVFPRQLFKYAVSCIRRKGVFALTCALVVLSSAACTTNFGKKNSSAKTSSSETGAPVTYDSGFLVLTRVMTSVNTPSSLDLIGDGSRSIGSYCTTEDATKPKCSCVFNFIDSSMNSRSEPVIPHYVESDLLRCNTAVVPATVSHFNVKIMLNSFNEATSNEVRVSQAVAGLDPVDPATFVKAERYQCRRIETIPHLFDPNIYDPVQSDDPRISFPRNFYTTNFGGAYTIFASQKLPNWSCPPNPSASNTAAGIDLSVYSVAPDGLGSNRIFPPQGSEFDRSTFYLAKAKTGIFNVAVNAFIAPESISPRNGIPPLGYAASPVPTTNGETCPDTATNIPPKFKWVKVWLFRKAFEPPKFPRSNAILNTQQIACNPGNEVASDNNTVLIRDCKGLPAVGTAGVLAARAIWSTSSVGSRGLCVKFSGLAETDACNSKLGPGCSTQTSISQFPNYSGFGLGTDIWEPARITGSCNLAAPDYPLNLCELNNAGTGPRGVPFDSNLSYEAVSTSDLGLTDYLFVVTPTTVMTTTMQNSSISDSDVYTPYRFLPGDCLSPDPLNPQTPGDCNPIKRVIYGLKLHDVGENSDPNSEDPNRPGVFPVCALQPE